MLDFWSTAWSTAVGVVTGSALTAGSGIVLARMRQEQEYRNGLTDVLLAVRFYRGQVAHLTDSNAPRITFPTEAQRLSTMFLRDPRIRLASQLLTYAPWDNRFPKTEFQQRFLQAMAEVEDYMSRLSRDTALLGQLDTSLDKLKSACDYGRMWHRTLWRATWETARQWIAIHRKRRRQPLVL